MTAPSLDALDRAILYRLQENAREAITHIADDLDVADNTVRNRIQNLEDESVIEGYQANVDYDRVGVQHYYFFDCSARVSEREGLAAAARDCPCVVEVATLMTGKHNVLVIAACAGKDEINRVACELDDLGLTVEREHLVREHTRHPFSGFRPENAN